MDQSWKFLLQTAPDFLAFSSRVVVGPILESLFSSVEGPLQALLVARRGKLKLSVREDYGQMDKQGKGTCNDLIRSRSGSWCSKGCYSDVTGCSDTHSDPSLVVFTTERVKKLQNLLFPCHVSHCAAPKAMGLCFSRLSLLALLSLLLSSADEREQVG